ncbi:MAG: ATP-binding protein [Desulfobacterales bacterium]|jgi:signal transduction histidine kinase|nr:ATP-binding protein [Desulfobacterales bacterium]
MSYWSMLKPAFWDHEDVAAGPHKHLFNFRRMWKSAVILTALVALAPLLFMTAIDYNVSQKAIEADIHYQTARLVSNTRRSISFFLSERKSALDFIDKDNAYTVLSEPLRLTALLDNLKKGFGGFTDLGVIDASGLQHTYVGPYNLAGINYSDQDWFQALQESGVHISEVFLGFRQQPHLVIAVKHNLPNGGFYVLRASIDTQKFNDLLGEVEVSGQGDIFLVTREGVLQTPSRFFGNALDQLPLEVPAFAGKTQVTEMHLQTEPLVVGYAYIQETPFVLMAVKKTAALMKPWNETRRQLIAFLTVSISGIVLVVLGVSTFLVNQIFEADHKRVAALHKVEYANKMASLGRLSAGVAHEINNPLAIINEKAGLIKDLFQLQRTYAEDAKLVGLVDAILYSVERCGKITKRLLGFARHLESKTQLVDIVEVIHEVLGFLGKEAEYRSITLTVDAEPALPVIESDRGRLQEIFLNLFNNAFAAMEDGGRLAISVRQAGTDFIAATVSDTGCGISESDLKRIFEPFFSTKTGKGGTGLGLSITYGLIQELDGSVSVRSEVGKGTEFTIRLPVNAKSTGEDESESPVGG